uniref:hypothetical protein n=1 Tax=Nonomuraea sp. CA-251285 TaxID=3240002 RepID=UPI003F496929
MSTSSSGSSTKPLPRSWRLTTSCCSLSSVRQALTWRCSYRVPTCAWRPSQELIDQQRDQLAEVIG